MRIMRFVVPIAIAGALLTGCKTAGTTPEAPATTAPADNGVKDLSADEILTKAKAAVKEAGSFRAKGTMTSEGEKMTIDVKAKGSDITGTVTTPMGAITILGVGGLFYFQADEAFWKAFGGPQGELVATLFKGKWVKVGADTEGFSDFADVANIDTLLTPEGTVTKGELTTVNGASVITLLDSKDQGKLYIATTGKPYPVRIESATAAEGGVDFTDFGAVFDEIKAPSADQIVDLDALMPK